MTLDDIRHAQVVFTRVQVPPAVAGDRVALRGAQYLASSFGEDVVYVRAVGGDGYLLPAAVHVALLGEWAREHGEAA